MSTFLILLASRFNCHTSVIITNQIYIYCLTLFLLYKHIEFQESSFHPLSLSLSLSFSSKELCKQTVYVSCLDLHVTLRHST